MEKKKEIAIIGNGNSLFVRDFIERTIDLQSNNITLLSSPVSMANIEYYSSRNIKVIITGVESIPEFCRKNKILRKAFLFREMHKNGRILKPEIVHVHQVVKSSCMQALLLCNKKTKLILTYYGSDLLAQQPTSVVEKCIQRADLITLSVKKMHNRFTELFGSGYDEKLRFAHFGDVVLDYIKENSLEMSRKDAKKHFGIDEDNIVIAVGYNGNREQQHKEVLKQIKEFSADKLEKVTILISATYGLDKEYLTEIEDEISDMNCRTLILKDFLSIEEVALLRLATDIYIHARTSDAFSASLQENIYVCNEVLIGRWLNYDELNGKGFSFLYFDTFEEMKEQLEALLVKAREKSNNTLKLDDNIFRLSSWSSVKERWIKIYQEEKKDAVYRS